MARQARAQQTLVDINDGAQGDAGDRRANGFIYRALTTAGSAPTGGSFDFTTGTLTPPTDWSLTAPSSTTAGQQIFVSYWTAAEGSTPILTYTTPVVAQLVVNDVKSIDYNGPTTLPTDMDWFGIQDDLGTGVTLTGYFLDADTDQILLSDVIARDFDVSGGDDANLRLGVRAGNPENVTGVVNTSIGFETNMNVTSGTGNISVGYRASQSVTTSSNAVAIGNEAHQFGTSPNSVNLGWQAGYRAISQEGIYIGAGAGAPTTASIFADRTESNTSRIMGINFAIGGGAIGGLDRSNVDDITATRNIAIGLFALENITSGSDNLSVGWEVGTSITSGEDNTILGTSTGQTLTTGSGNVIVGNNADASTETTFSSIAIGGSAESDSNGIAIGFNTEAGTAGIALGALANASANECQIRSNNVELYPATSTTHSGLSFTGRPSGTQPTFSDYTVLAIDPNNGLRFNTSGFDVNFLNTNFTFDDGQGHSGTFLSFINQRAFTENTETEVDITQRISPGTDNAIDLGTGTLRFEDIFAANGTINTSDRNEKQQIRSLTDTEMRVAGRINTVTYKWNSAVEEKGDNARTHVGVIAQDVVDAFTEEGLNAFDYGLVGRDDLDADIMGQNDGDPNWRYNVRYAELNMFLHAYTKQRQDDLEARIAALEN